MCPATPTRPRYPSWCLATSLALACGFATLAPKGAAAFGDPAGHAPKQMNEQRFSVVKRERGLRVVGVAGFSGQWKPELVAKSPRLQATVQKSRAVLRRILMREKRLSGNRLIVSSGASDFGAPGLAYDVAKELHIPTMGVTPEEIRAYRITPGLRYMVMKGKRFGQESPAFVRTLDRLIVIGGGRQANKEARGAGRMGKDVVLFHGAGGASDHLSGASVPHAEVAHLAGP